jgi:hypothetical protein
MTVVETFQAGAHAVAKLTAVFGTRLAGGEGRLLAHVIGVTERLCALRLGTRKHVAGEHVAPRASHAASAANTNRRRGRSSRRSRAYAVIEGVLIKIGRAGVGQRTEK